MRIIEGKEKPYDPQATLVDYGVACQSLGFQNGFKLAVRMMAECMMD